MSKVLEVDREGVLAIPPDLLPDPEPHARYLADVEGDSIVLRPAPERRLPLWATLTPEERIQDLLEWAEAERPPAPPLSDEALRRESIYE